MAQSFTSSRNRKTAAKGLSNELLAQAKFAKDPNLIVFTPVGSKGPIDLLVLNLTTGEYTAYDVKTQNFRSNGEKIYRGRTDEQRKLGVKIFNFNPENPNFSVFCSGPRRRFSEVIDTKNLESCNNLVKKTE